MIDSIDGDAIAADVASGSDNEETGHYEEGRRELLHSCNFNKVTQLNARGDFSYSYKFLQCVLPIL